MVLNSYSIQHEFAQCNNPAVCAAGSETCQQIDDSLRESMVTVLWQMCALGVAMWVAQYVLTVALQTAAMRQVARIRTKVRYQNQNVI